MVNITIPHDTDKGNDHSNVTESDHGFQLLDLVDDANRAPPRLISFDILYPWISDGQEVSSSGVSARDFKKEEEEEALTKLELYKDPWIIKKKLNKSDLGELCRLLIPTNQVNEHVLPFLSREVACKVHGENGATVSFWDVNTQTQHTLTFKQWPASRSYVFMNGWSKDFVQRRRLMKGDEIGLFFNSTQLVFYFNVISRAEVH